MCGGRRPLSYAGRSRPGERRIGAVLHDFDAGGVTSQTVFIDGTQDLAIDPVLGEIYPAPSAIEAALS